MPRIIHPEPEEIEEAEKETTGYTTIASFSPDEATAQHETDLYMAENFDDSSSSHWQLEEQKRRAKHEALVVELDQPIDPSLLKQRDAFEGSKKKLTYAEWHTIVRRLNQYFGHDGWTTRVLKMVNTGEDHKSGAPHHVSAVIELTVRWPHGGTSTFTNVGTGENRGAVIYKNRQPVYDDEGQKVRRYTWSGYDMAVKTAVHDGIKRCATALGDAFGLGLYDDDAPTEERVEVETTVDTTAPTPIRPKVEYPIATEDDVAACEDCGKEIKGYTNNKTGKSYTTADLVDMSKRFANGRVLCYDCRNKNK